MRKKTLKTLIIWGIVIILVIAITITFNSYISNKASSALFDISISKGVVTPGYIAEEVSTSGTIGASDTLQIASSAQGIIEDIYFEVGDYVSIGDELASIDVDALDNDIYLKEAEIAAKEGEINSYLTIYETDYVRSPVNGRIKEINVEYIDQEDVRFDYPQNDWDDVEYEHVEDIMAEYGYLAAIALGDSMYVVTQENTDKYSVGMELRVVIDDYKSVEYSNDVFVEKIVDNKVYISIPSNRVMAYNTVKIYSLDGNLIGNGISEYLDIVYVVAERGQIMETKVLLNERVVFGKVLYRLHDFSPQAIRDMFSDLDVLNEELVELIEMSSHSNIISPIDGYITISNFTKSMQINNDDIAFEIADISRLEIVVQVDELDAIKTQKNMSASINVGAMPDNEYTGVVEKISSLGVNSKGVTTYEVIVSFPYEQGLKLMMNADVDILIKESKNTLNVPANAIKTDDGQTYVMVYNERSPQEIEIIKSEIMASGLADSYDTFTMASKLYGSKTMVKIGIQNDEYVEISNGLDEGDVVIVEEEEDAKASFIGMGKR